MKRFFFLLTLVLSLASIAVAQTKTGDLSLDSGVKPHAGIDAVYGNFSRAYRELDHSLVGGLYAVDAAYLVPNEDVMTGRDKVTASFKSFFDYVKERKGRLEIKFRILQRRVSGDLAYDVGIYTLTQFDAEGKSTTGQGKFVVVAVKEKNEWQFQVDGYSDLPKPK